MMPAYPISIDKSGGLSISLDPEVDNVRALIDTKYFERCMFPNYGVTLDEFDPVSSDSLAVLIMSLSMAIDLWHSFVTDIQLDNQELDNGSVSLIINVSGTEVILDL